MELGLLLCGGPPKLNCLRLGLKRAVDGLRLLARVGKFFHLRHDCSRAEAWYVALRDGWLGSGLVRRGSEWLGRGLSVSVHENSGDVANCLSEHGTFQNVYD